MIGAAGVAAGTAFIINIALIPLIIRLAHRFKWYDFPDNKRKIHSSLIPHPGGPGIFLAFLISSIISPLLISLLTRGRSPVYFDIQFLPVFAGIFLVLLVGVYDDFRNLRALYKFILQLLAASIVAGGGFLIRTISLPYIGSLNLGLFAYPVTIIWIVGISTAINFIDGLDGLAGGITAIAALSMGVIALIQGTANTAILIFSLFGAVAGFLIYNFPPAKIFMGDSGSLMLGFTLAVFPLLGISGASAFGTLIIPVTLLTIPILDTASAIFRRIKQKRSIASPDKEHIHHRLINMGLSERQILGIIYGFCSYLGLVAISSVILPKEINVYLIIVVWVGSLLGYWLLRYIGSKRTAAEKQKSRLNENSNVSNDRSIS